ncbi:MAG: DnaA/Hda family protein [Beijerinckiaceae bacterium]|nr:DnaA/Hda family protein [Beijerinckiaceae bacterium]
MWPDEAGPRKKSSARQLILDLTGAPATGAEDFLVSSSNEQAFGLIDLWPEWPAPTLILTGPAGSGKSHLAAIWARRAQARILRPDEDLEPETLARHAAILMEDCDRVRRPEAALFHLINLLKETGGSLLLTARQKPDLWGITTPDLLSRLRLAPTAAIGRPDSALLRAVLVKLFTDRQIRIEEDVIVYAALHLDQSLEEAARFVQAVDEAALSAGRRITKPLAAATIATMNGAERGGAA